MDISSNKRKVKILYVITKSNWGGAQKYVYDLATRLSSSYKVSVAIGNEGTALTEKLLAAKIRVLALPHALRDVGIIDGVKTFFDLLRIFKKETPDIVHLNSPQVGGLGAFAARVYNILTLLPTTDYRPPAKIIFTSHGWAWNEDRNF